MTVGTISKSTAQANWGFTQMYITVIFPQCYVPKMNILGYYPLYRQGRAPELHPSFVGEARSIRLERRSKVLCLHRLKLHIQKFSD